MSDVNVNGSASKAEQETGVLQKRSRRAPSSINAKQGQPTRRKRESGARRNASRQATRGRKGRASAADMAGSTDYLRRIIGIVGAVLALFIVIGLVDMATNWGKIYTGVHIGAVDASGMSLEEAEVAVNSYYGSRIMANDIRIYGDEATMEKARSGQKIENLDESEYLSVDEVAEKRRVWTTNAASLQATVDATELATEALQVGRENGGVFARISAHTLGWNVEPRIELSDSAIESLAKSIDRAIGDEHVDYDVYIDGGVAYVSEGRTGKEVNRNTLRSQITSQLMDEEVEEGFVAVTEEAPVRITKDAAQAVADKINAGIAHGATFTFEGTNWEASTYDLGSLIVTKAKKDAETGEWTLVASYDESSAKSAILSNLQSTFSKQNVKVEFVKSGDSIIVQTNATGKMPETGMALSALTQQTLEATPASTPVIAVEGTEIPATMSIESALDYGVVTTISSFETEYTGGADNRNTNIHLAADLLNNSIAKANGGTWSFNEVAGECNAEKGFKNAGAILDGQVVDDIGGGICQVATTVFNAVYEAGLPVDERSNHSLYIASYPSGRDAAINWPELDLVWHNDTPSDILMQTSYTDTTITVSLIGVDPGYTVETVEGEFKDGAKYSTRTEVSKDLAKGETQVKQYGSNGTSIEVKRKVKDATGQIVREDTFTSVYDAQDEIIQVGPDTEIDLSSDSEDEETANGDAEDEEGIEDSESSEPEYEG